MIPSIATIIAAYVVVQLCSLTARDTERPWVKALASAAICATVFLVVCVWLDAAAIDRQNAIIQKQAQALQGLATP